MCSGSQNHTLNLFHGLADCERDWLVESVFSGGVDFGARRVTVAGSGCGECGGGTSVLLVAVDGGQ